MTSKHRETVTVYPPAQLDGSLMMCTIIRESDNNKIGSQSEVCVCVSLWLQLLSLCDACLEIFKLTTSWFLAVKHLWLMSFVIIVTGLIWYRYKQILSFWAPLSELHNVWHLSKENEAWGDRLVGWLLSFWSHWKTCSRGGMFNCQKK